MRPSGYPIIVAFALAAACLLATVSCGGDARRERATSSPQTPPATATAKPSPSPTVAPADPNLGDRLRNDGDFEQAIAVYASIASASDGEKRQDALLAQAQLLSRTKRFAEARTSLESWLANAGISGAGSTAQYLLASTLDDLDDPLGALNNYDAYIAAGGPASDFARVERAKMLARLGRTVDADQAAEAVVASGLPQQYKATFTFSIGRAFEQAHADANALNWYNRVKLTPGGDVASALAKTGAIKRRLGDATWVQDYLEAITSYPASGVASGLLDELDAAGVPVADYVRGLVDYRAFRNDAARTAFTRAIAQQSHAAEATYYIGALDERAGDATSAIGNYMRSVDLDPRSAVADDAVWWRARLLEDSGRLDEAAATYAALAPAYPNSSWRDDAEFRSALIVYRKGNVPSAAQMFGAIASHASGDDRERARYWQGRALVEAGDASGKRLLEQLRNDDPTNFYGLRAEVLLNENDAKARSTSSLKEASTDWKKIASYITQQTGSDADVASQVQQDPRWAQTDELRAVGLTDQSDAVVRSVIDQYAADPVALMQVTERLQESGNASNAARAATRLISVLPPNAPPPPDDLLRIAYPAVYNDLVKDSAKKESVSPLLLLSLMRQESYYDPDAGSSAGALGLTQVVPTTGKSIAKNLSVENFSAEDLYRPNVSIQFGANYLGEQLSEFDGDPYRALAAYNGGPGVVTKAAKTSGNDEDLFVEDLEFDETKTYVKRVMENYARYRQLYEKTDHPSLPE
jgi:soluble lytic murein transglycosylase